ncbi:GIY-YIG nuclease family protein [Acidobacteria bacterium AH-259-D05]|nr:GIY-YIG nuclease family protein [Acidobacteria bacterium AH-259-D05]
MGENQSYQLHIWLRKRRVLNIGRLGRFAFPAGYYVYTGSAKTNIQARVQRHLTREKRIRWHIDYLLADPYTSVVDIRLSRDPECYLNQSGQGVVIVPGFGSSDCKHGCGAHLKFVGSSATLDRQLGKGQK